MTQEELKEVLHLNQDGTLVWRVSRGGKTKAGDIAGCNETKGYWCIRYKRIAYKAHRLVWLYVYGKFPNGQIDHIDGNKSNNRVENLRECSQSENQRNVLLRQDNTSGFKCVSKDKKTGKWKVRAQIEGKRKFLGYFNTPEEASDAYQEFTKLHHKEFYRDTTQ